MIVQRRGEQLPPFNYIVVNSTSIPTFPQLSSLAPNLAITIFFFLFSLPLPPSFSYRMYSYFCCLLLILKPPALSIKSQVWNFAQSRS
jgi:hypothetical protein